MVVVVDFFWACRFYFMKVKGGGWLVGGLWCGSHASDKRISQPGSHTGRQPHRQAATQAGSHTGRQPHRQAGISLLLLFFNRIIIITLHMIYTIS